MPTLQNLRYAVRSLRRSPLSSGFIVATLAICIGAVAAVYSVAEVVLIRGLPFERPEQLVWISSVKTERPDAPFSLPEFMDYRAQVRSVRIGGYANWSAILESSSGAERLQGLRMTGDGLGILGATPAAGRLLTASDDAPGAPRVLMLGYGYWKQSLGGDPTVVGKTLPLNGERYTVVGVLPRFFPLPVTNIDVIVPFDPESDPRRNARNSVNFTRLFGRLQSGVTLETAEKELNAFAARLRDRFPTEYATKLGARPVPLQEYLAATLKPTLVVLLACVSLMIGVALVNVLNLLLARAVTRQGETAVRIALGASRPRIAAQLLTEGALLAGVAGIIGTGLAYLAIVYGRTHLLRIAPRIEEARIGLPVLGVVFGLCAIAVLLFSLVPMLIARGTSPQTVLRGAGRSGSGSKGQNWLRSSFVVAEVALALIIASAAGALLQNLIGLQRVEMGYRPDSVFIARLSLPPKQYASPAKLAQFTSEMSAALAGRSEVLAAGGTTLAPLSGALASIPFAPADHPPAERRDWPSATFQSISSGYLTAIGARLIAGRSIEDDDDVAAPPVAVINRAMAEKHFATGGAVGRELLIDDNDTGPRRVTIVGVVENLRDIDLDQPVKPGVFISLKQVHPDGAGFAAAIQFWAVRVRGKPGSFGPGFTQLLRRVDPSVATAGLSDLRAYVDAMIAPRSFSVGLLGTFTFIALLLTTIGVYGIAAYTVEQRRREIGVRMALGASPQSIVGLMLGRTLRLAGIGVGLGLVGAWLVGGVMSRIMFGVTAGSPMVLAAVSALLLSTALLASWLPGLRASRLDTSEVLSND